MSLKIVREGETSLSDIREISVRFQKRNLQCLQIVYKTSVGTIHMKKLKCTLISVELICFQSSLWYISVNTTC
jgi:hypothetical protein